MLIWHVLLEILRAQMLVIKRVVRERKELSKTVFDIIFTHCLDVVSGTKKLKPVWLTNKCVRLLDKKRKIFANAVFKVPSRRYYSCEIKVPSRRHLIKKSAVPARPHCSCKVVVLSRPQSNYISTAPSRRHRSLKDYDGSSFDIEI